MDEIKKLSKKDKAAVNGWFGTHDIKRSAEPSQSFADSGYDEAKDRARAASNRAMGVPVRDYGDDEKEILEFSDEEKEERRAQGRRAVNKFFGIGK